MGAVIAVWAAAVLGAPAGAGTGAVIGAVPGAVIGAPIGSFVLGGAMALGFKIAASVDRLREALRIVSRQEQRAGHV